MKTAKTLTLIGALSLGLAGAAWAQETDPPPPPGGPPSGGPGFRGPPKEILEKYDLNKDGKLDQTERAALRQDVEDGKIAPPPFARGPRGPRGPQGFGGPNLDDPPKDLLDKYDANHDGKLDETERAALRRDIRDGKLPPPNPPTAKQIIEKFDADKDGKLDETELEAFLQDMRKHLPPLRRPMGPRPGGPPVGELRQ